MGNPLHDDAGGVIKKSEKGIRLHPLRQRRFFLAGVILATAVLCASIPGRSARADPIVFTPFPVIFSIVEYGASFPQTVELIYIPTGTDRPFLDLLCTQFCHYSLPEYETSIHSKVTYSLIIKKKGREDFTIEGFNIYYNAIPNYLPGESFWHYVTIDIGWQTCSYLPDNRDPSFYIAACSREPDAGGASGSATAIVRAISEEETQYIVTCGGKETATAAVATLNAPKTATKSAEWTFIPGTNTAIVQQIQASSTAFAKITVDVQKNILATNDAQNTQISASEKTAYSLTAIATSGAQSIDLAEQQTIISSLWLEIPLFFTTLIILVIFIAVCLELTVAFILIRKIFESPSIPSWRIVLSGIFINVVSIPCAWKVMGFLGFHSPWSHLFDVLVTEILVVMVEALWYRITLPLRFRQVLLVSLTANLASYAGGVILFGF